MSAIKSLNHCHVAWSKNQKDKFIAISTDVKLFEFSNQSQSLQATRTPQYQSQSLSQQFVVIGSTGSSTTHIAPNSLSRQKQTYHNDHFMNSRLIASGPEINQFKAASCYPGSISEDDTLVAISCGASQGIGGRILLVCLRPSAVYSIDNYIHVDLVTRRSLCNDVDWSLLNNSLIATAWDRYKLDNSLQIFDINRIIDTNKYSFNFSMTPNNRPIFDGCSGDYVNSLSWYKEESSVVCGINGKSIKIFDLRDCTKPRLMTQTRAVYGLTVDPFCDKRFASFVDNSLYIWDTRFFDKPLVSIIESKPISQISWCPTRNHHFSALRTGDHFVKIYDIQQASLFSEDFDAKIVERLIHPFATSSIAPATPLASNANMFYDMSSSSSNTIPTHSSNPQKQITSYDWHPVADARMIAISNTRDVIALNICDRITLNWSPICEIVWTKGKKILQCLDSRDEKYKSLDDISVNMRQRAITNYGMIVEDGPHHQRGDDSDLIGLLRWVKLAKSLDISNTTKQQQVTNASDTSICSEILGVGTLIRNSNEQISSRVEVRTINWTGFSPASSCLVAPIRVHVYHSEIRSRALLLCDWIPDIDNISQTIPIIDYLEKEGNYLRAAAIAVFNMRLQRAIESLTLGAKKGDSNLSSVAMALSGYTGERTSVWREMCQSLKNQLNNPYMKAMFAFLTCDSDTNFSDITDDKDLILVDRVAFSLLYLPDDKLNVYLSETMSTLVDNGDLNGILLTGITNDGLNLLQRYIEISSDIQSVSLIVLHSLPSLICTDKRAQLWVECYRGMLDCWRLWHHRAHFDNLWYSNASNLAKPPIHILINCNYCGNPINKSSRKQAQYGSCMMSHHHYSLQSPTMNSINVPTIGFSSEPNATAQLNQQSTSYPHNVNDFLNQRQSSTAYGSNPVSILNTTHSFNNAVSDTSPSPSLTGQTVTVNTQSSSSSIGSSMPPIDSHNINQSSSQQTLVANTITTMSNVRTKSSLNCKKCSYAKCCLCLTQLGSNVINDQRSIQSFNQLYKNSARPRNLSLNNDQFSFADDNVKPFRNSTQQQTISTTTLLASNANTRTHQLSNWFSWCQTCRHGAHSAHLLSWFNENSECPVSGCECKCMNLDSRSQFGDVSYSNFKYKFH